MIILVFKKFSATVKTVVIAVVFLFSLFVSMNKLCIEGEQSNKKITQSFNEMYCSFFESASKNKKSSIGSPLFGSKLVTSLVEMSSKSILFNFNFK